MFKYCSVILVLVVSGYPVAAAADIPVGNKAACMEGPLAQFGQYIGNWDIADSQLSQDGKEWIPGAGAKWNFVCIGQGTAVQDFWMPNDGPVGTNLRTYNGDAAIWDIAWTIPGIRGAGFAHITAEAKPDGRIEMKYEYPLPNPLRRITFFPVDESGWDWTLELSTDSGESWITAYKIRATPSEVEAVDGQSPPP